MLGPERTTDLYLINLCKSLNIPLNGVFSKNELPKQCMKGGYIINLQNSDEGNGTHWVALWFDKNCSVYFDSFGIPPPWEVINFCKCKKLKYSDVQIQGVDIAYCGQFCSLFLKCMSEKGDVKNKYNKFINNFKHL